MTRRLIIITLMLFGTSTVTFAKNAYSVGVVPQFEPRKISHIWQPILSEASKLSGLQLQLKASANMQAFEKQLSDGSFDFAYMSPYHAITARLDQGYQPLLRDTARKLYGIIVVKKDSPIQSVQALDGQTVAFPSPSALGATLMPKAELFRKFNITLDSLYTTSHSSVYLNVIMGTAIAGGGVQKTFDQQNKKVRDKLRTLYTTESILPHPISVHPRVLQTDQERFKSAFLSLGLDVKKKHLLAKVPIKKIGSANINDYESVKELNLETFLNNKDSQ